MEEVNGTIYLEGDGAGQLGRCICIAHYMRIVCNKLGVFHADGNYKHSKITTENINLSKAAFKTDLQYSDPSSVSHGCVTLDKLFNLLVF